MNRSSSSELEAMVAELLERVAALEKHEAEPPRCRICGVRAWPGDDARHIYSLHAERP